MIESLFPFAYLHDARLAAHATGMRPVWLWRPDGRGILWANAAGAALRGEESPARLSAQPVPDNDSAGLQIARLAHTLPANGSPRLQQIDGFAAECGHTILCLCSRMAFCEQPVVLVIGTEPGGPTLPTAERVRRLLADTEAPVAAFSADGTLLHVTPAGADRMGGLTTLASLGAGALATDALSKGHAEGRTPLGVLRVDRLGRDDTTVLLTRFPLPIEPRSAVLPSTAAPPAPPPPKAEPASPGTEAIPESVAQETSAPRAALERQQPLRFVWQMDREGRFTVDSEAFTELIGPQSAAVLGEPWIDIAAKRKLDPDGQVEDAVASQQTWSGITVHWPVDGSGERLAVELSGLPMFDRDRAFRGYRGFGICRNAEQFAHLPRPAATERTETGGEAGVGRAPAPSEPEPRPNVVPFPSASAADGNPSLSPVERSAFRELARQLSARLKGDDAEQDAPEEAEGETLAAAEPAAAPPQAPPSPPAWSALPGHSTLQTAAELVPQPADLPQNAGAQEILDRMPAGVLVYRISTPLYANRAFLDWSGHTSLDAFVTAGGLDGLFLESGLVVDSGDHTRLTLAAESAHGLAASRLFSISWEGEPAHALVIVPNQPAAQELEPALRREEAKTRELTSLLDTAADGVVTVDPGGTIVSANRGSEILFGAIAEQLVGQPFLHLLAAHERSAVAADLDALWRDGPVRRPGREVTACARGADSAALFMTLGRIVGEPPTVCAVFRDIGPWKRSELDLLAAKRQAEQASRAKSDFLAKVSHTIRTPLNAIIGFSEVMMQERLGPIGNERYRTYLNDIHASGQRLIALLNDLLDLSQIEAGTMEFSLAAIDLNAETQRSVAQMQPQANAGRVIIRTSLAPSLPPILADERSTRQILVNLLSNAIKYTGPGGQVIVSTGLTDRSEVVLRVRDTGIGMSERAVESALEPFREVEISTQGAAGGTGLGLPLIKALAEANRARCTIKSIVGSGTLVEIAFPTARAAAR